MWQSMLNWLGAERYSQHAICLTNDPVMIVLYVVSDLTTFFSYFMIGLSMLLLLRSQDLIEVRPMLRIMYGAFIFLCGLSHLTAVMTLFSGVYRLDILVRVAMAVVSIITAVTVVNDLYKSRTRTV